MNDGTDDFDQRLAELFAGEHTHLPAEPFLTVTKRALAAERKRATLTARAVKAAGLVALVALSSLLIEASVWLSAQLDELFEAASAWLASPVGLAVVVIGVLVALGTKWARVW